MLYTQWWLRRIYFIYSNGSLTLFFCVCDVWVHSIVWGCRYMGGQVCSPAGAFKGQRHVGQILISVIILYHCPFFFPFEKMFLSEPGTHWFSRLPGQWVPVIVLLLTLMWLLGIQTQTFIFPHEKCLFMESSPQIFSVFNKIDFTSKRAPTSWLIKAHVFSALTQVTSQILLFYPGTLDFLEAYRPFYTGNITT